MSLESRFRAVIRKIRFLTDAQLTKRTESNRWIVIEEIAGKMPDKSAGSPGGTGASWILVRRYHQLSHEATCSWEWGKS